MDQRFYSSDTPLSLEKWFEQGSLANSTWQPVEVTLTRESNNEIGMSVKLNGENLMFNSLTKHIFDTGTVNYNNFRIQIQGRTGGLTMDLYLDDITLQIQK